MNIKTTFPSAELEVIESRTNATNTKSMNCTARKEKEAAKKARSMPTKTQVPKLP
jgi:hypothetical protein